MTEYHAVEQNSPEWLALRTGRPTASEFAKVMAKGRGATRATYMRTLAGERITGDHHEGHSNAHMQRGHDMEDELRRGYAFRENVDPTPAGFVTLGRYGASPDSLVGADGLLEVKSKAPHLLVDVVRKGDESADWYPPEHRAQIQGQLYVTGRKWCDLVVGWIDSRNRDLIWTRRVLRDDEYISDMVEQLDSFVADLDALVERVRRCLGLTESDDPRWPS